VFNSDIQQELANTYGFVLCATDEIGMANGDLANTAGILAGRSSGVELDETGVKDLGGEIDR
jgi:hypothetical protein